MYILIPILLERFPKTFEFHLLRRWISLQAYLIGDQCPVSDGQHTATVKPATTGTVVGARGYQSTIVCAPPGS
jgi:hypothetical protein